MHGIRNWQDGLAKRLLSSWNALLEELGGVEFSMLSPTLAWEFLSIDKALYPDLQAKQRERQLLKRLQEKILCAEKTLFKFGDEHLKPLSKIIRSPSVSDVISLNVDLLIERLYLNDKGMPSLFNRSKLDTEIGLVKQSSNLLRCRELQCHTTGSSLRVWHPHGDRLNRQSMAFGIWRYERLISQLVKARGEIKREENKVGYKSFQEMVANQPKNWLELMMFRPLIFIGTSTDYAEWDIWFGLVARWRNFAKATNAEHLPPVWCLDIEDLDLGASKICKVPNGRVHRLTAPDWDTAWKWLAGALNPVGTGS